jgi:hypothetical protein
MISLCSVNSVTREFMTSDVVITDYDREFMTSDVVITDYDRDELSDLAMCVLGNDFYRAKRLLENGIDIHENDDIAIRFASEIGNFKMIVLLVIYGADICVWNNWSIRISLANNHVKVAKFLGKCRFLNKYDEQQIGKIAC